MRACVGIQFSINDCAVFYTRAPRARVRALYQAIRRLSFLPSLWSCHGIYVLYRFLAEDQAVSRVDVALLLAL